MSENQKQVLAIGKENVVKIFKFIGFGCIYVDDEKDLITKFENLKKNIDQYKIIYITENFYTPLKSEIDKLSERVTPVITLIPDSSGSQNIAKEMIRKTVEQAAGSDILSK